MMDHPSSRLSPGFRRDDGVASGAGLPLICPTGGERGLLSSPFKKKIPLFRISDLSYITPHPASLAEGRFADVTRREAGCGGRGGAVRRAAAFADGEVVWSWRPKDPAPSCR
jgi:hypothetical protein